METSDPQILLVRMENGAAALENSPAVLQNIKPKATM